ncbi:MAG TPA: hypothetical protein VGS17_08090 [Candidatus Limnocylindria bacterium]|nr:hypothetical protein [Candidatus Limnocylindria bacterium]
MDERLIALGLAQPAPEPLPAPEPVFAPPSAAVHQVDERRAEPGLAQLFPELVRRARSNAAVLQVGQGLAGLGLDTPVAEPMFVARPSAAVRQAVRVRNGRRDRDALCELDASGIRITGLDAPLFIPWPDARAISVDGGYVTVVSPAGSIALGVALDGVSEPGLAQLFADVLEAGRHGTLEPNTGTLHELGLGIDRTLETFGDADDPVVPLAVGAVVAFVGLVLLAALPTILQLVAHLNPPLGSFALMPRIAFFDPRVIVAAFALSSGLAVIVGEFALGAAAMAWARGTLRGWHRNASGLEATARLAIARLMLGSRVAALVAGVAIISLLPSAFARAVIDADGIHEASGFPVLSRDRSWAEVVDVAPLAVGFGERVEGFDTMLVFSGGDRLSTRGRDLAGGTVRQIYDFARTNLR